MVGYVNCSITELYNKLMIYYFSDFVCFSSNNNSMLLSTQITINVKYFHILFLFKNFLPEFVWHLKYDFLYARMKNREKSQ